MRDIDNIIHVLDEQVASQIAAGEVIERPASVVKELVENALDAGARRIAVEILGAGRQLIAVNDDGCGMSPTDARLSLRRHATSKISAISDLNQIGTFGFRGEALASIASVARLEMRTRRAKDNNGFLIRAVGGEVVEESVCSMAPGTRIEARDLFFNTPARLKFLKSNATEQAAIIECIQRLALSHPTVSFKLNIDGRTSLDLWAATSFLERIRQLFGNKFEQDLIEFSLAGSTIHVYGFATHPTISFASPRMIFTFVNSRPVRDRLLNRAISQAYAGLLPRERFPAVIMFVEIPKQEVDVNVHPTKLEVRFRNPTVVFESAFRALRNSLSKPTEQLSLEADSKLPSPSSAALLSYPIDGPSHSEKNQEGEQASLNVQPSRPNLKLIFERGSSEARSSLVTGSETTGQPPVQLANLQRGTQFFSSLRLLGQMHATYIVLEDDQGLLLVDQHAAHERITYEKLRSELRSGGVKVQPLLVPQTIEISAELAARVLGTLPALRTLGFEAELFGSRSIVLKGSPAIFGANESVRLFRDLLDSVGEEGFVLEDLSAHEAKLKLLACHGSVRAGMVMTESEMRSLLAELDRTPYNTNCPHGRPVFIRFNLTQIERLFRR